MLPPLLSTGVPGGTRTAATVLVVGSDRASTERLASALSDGHTQVAIATEQEALALTSKIRPAVVLLRLPLADESATTVAATLKQGPPPHPHIIALERSVRGETVSVVTDPAIDESIAAKDAPALLIDRVRSAIGLHALEVDRQDRLTELLVLEELGRLHGLDADVGTVLWAVARQMVGLAGVDFVAIGRAGDERPMWTMRDRSGVAGGPSEMAELDAGVRTLLSALHRRPAAEFEDLRARELPARPRAAARRLGLRVLFRLPLTIGSQSSGDLVVGGSDAESYTRRQAARIQHISRLVAAMIERRTLLDDARRRAERLRRLQDVIRLVTTASDTDAMLRAATEGAVALLAADTAGVWTTVGEGSRLRLVAAVGSPTITSRSADALIGRVARTGQAEVRGRGHGGHVDGVRFVVPLLAGGRALGVLAVSTGPGRDPADDAVGALTMLADNLAVALANACLNGEVHRATEQLDKAARLTALDRVSASLVHDMVQPVTAALGMLEMLVDEEKLSPAGQMLAERMHRTLSRIGRAVHQAPDVDGGRLDRPSGIDVRRVVDDALGLVEHELRLGGIELIRHVTPDLPPVAGDADALVRVFVNLLVNARDAMAGRTGRVTLTVEAIAGTSGDQVAVSVRDEGHGIPEEIRARLFEPLFTTKERMPGLGLGLSICRQIVEQVGGSIDIESVEGQGACFKVVLPAYRSPSSTGPT